MFVFLTPGSYTGVMGIISYLIPHAYAALSITPAPAPSGPADANTLITNLTSSAIGILFLLGGSLAVIYLLWSGVKYITAGGNADQTKQARAGIVNAVIGIIIMMAAFAIIRFSVGIGTWLSKGAPATGSSTTASSPKNTNNSSNLNSTNNGTNCPDGFAVGPGGECIPPSDNTTNSTSNTNNDSNRNGIL